VRAPAGQDQSLRAAMQALRQEGHIVVQVFPGETATHDEFVFDRELVLQNGQWKMQHVV
jgi:ATP phosphoribosyltransferase regulatory subunit